MAQFRWICEVSQTTQRGRRHYPALDGCGRVLIRAISRFEEEAGKRELPNLDVGVHLWQEKQIRSVANVTRPDVREFPALAAEIPIRPEIQERPVLY